MGYNLWLQKLTNTFEHFYERQSKQQNPEYTAWNSAVCSGVCLLRRKGVVWSDKQWIWWSKSSLTGGIPVPPFFQPHDGTASSNVRKKDSWKNEVRKQRAELPQWIPGWDKLWRQTSPQRIPWDTLSPDEHRNFYSERFRPRCHEAPGKDARIAETSPEWASEMISLGVDRPRSFRFWNSTP